MERIILIGNGFDLSHGLKTSYGDFALWHFLKAYENLANPHISTATASPLIELEKGNFFNYKLPEKLSISLIKEFQKADIVRLAGKKVGTIKLLGSPDSKKPKNKLFLDSLEELIHQRWVDFEMAYYRKLIEVLTTKGHRLPTGYLHKDGINYIQKLNANFDQIRVELESYLELVAGENKNIAVMEEYLEQFFCPLFSHHRDEIFPENVTFLNFNFTSVIRKYLKVWNDGEMQTFDNSQSKKIPTKVIDIHGQLGDSRNPINFGFGSELDQNYKELLSLRDNEAIKFVKNNDYHRTTGYQETLQLIQRPFEVLVFGHSCGQSDGTLLHQIFDNENLKGIKIYPHNGYNHYKDIKVEIRSHCKNPTDLDLKFQIHNDDTRCPQILSTTKTKHTWDFKNMV